MSDNSKKNTASIVPPSKPEMLPSKSTTERKTAILPGRNGCGFKSISIASITDTIWVTRHGWTRLFSAQDLRVTAIDPLLQNRPKDQDDLENIF